MYKPQRQFMELAIKEARAAEQVGDYGIGAVIVRGDEILATGGNRIKLDEDPTHHAEIVAIRAAAKKIGSRYLLDSVLYTTHEPCPMCAAAAIWARMDGIVFGSRLSDMANYARRNGTHEWTWRVIDMTAAEVIEKGDPKLFLIPDFMRERCLELFHTDNTTVESEPFVTPK